MLDRPWTALFPRARVFARFATPARLPVMDAMTPRLRPYIPPPGRQVRDEIHTAFGTCGPVCLALHTHDTADPLCRTYRGEKP